MEDQETNRISKNPSKSIISLKDIPPLDPSSIPRNSTLKSRTVKQRNIEMNVNKVDEDKLSSSFSNIRIDPNSTRCTQEKILVPKPEEEEEEDTKLKSKDESNKGSAKLMLHEICTCKRWKPPVYECCKAEGPCHMRLFTYKVMLEIRDSSGTSVLECFGSPKSKKKAAAEHAAEGAIWYLEHVNQKQTKFYQ